MATKKTDREWSPITYSTIAHAFHGDIDSVFTVCGLPAPKNKGKFYLEHFRYRHCQACEKKLRQIDRQKKEGFKRNEKTNPSS